MAPIAKYLGRGLLALGAAGGVAYAADPGTRRSMTFWTNIMPVYAEYRWYQWKLKGQPDDVTEPIWNALHTKHAPGIEELTLRLKGFYLKNLQVMATQDAFVPAPYLAMCKRMQNQVPSPLEPGEARRIVIEAIGEDPFDYFEDVPVAAASIGQVHRARLKNRQEYVAVKVQYPNIEEKFRADIDTTIRFCQLAMPSQVPAMMEIRKQFVTEFDYVAEAEQQDAIRIETMAKFSDRVQIPHVHKEFCRRTVLVQEWLNGPTLVAGIRKQYEAYAKRMGTTMEALEEKQKQGLKDGTIKLHSVAAERRKHHFLYAIVRIQDTIKNIGRVLYNFSVRLVTGGEKKLITWSSPPVDLGYIMLLLNEVHADQLFMQESGFNGDCHPGNILLLPDGRIGLVDYGQVKKITHEQRAQFARVLIALAEDKTAGQKVLVKDSADRQRVVAAQTGLGFRTKNMDPEVLYRISAFWNDRDDADISMGMNISEFIDEMERRDPVVGQGFPQDFVMPSRILVLLRGVGNAFGLQMRSSPLWAPTARAFLTKYEKEIEAKQQQRNADRIATGGLLAN